MLRKSLSLILIVFSFTRPPSVLANECLQLATKIIKPRPKKKMSNLSSGLVTEWGQSPTILFMNLNAEGPGFNLAQKQVIQAFVENTKKAEMIIPSSKKDFISLAQFAPDKKETIDFILSEESAKRLKVNYLFKDKEYAIDSVLWTRDYAPVKIYNKSLNKFELIAFKYLKAEPKKDSLYKKGARYIEDIQEKIADTLKLKLKHSDLAVEGGNMLSDEKGNVYISSKLLENNPAKTASQIESELLELGLGEKIIWLTKLPNDVEPTGHVDLVMRFIGPNKVFVPSSKNKKANSAFNKIAKELKQSGLEIERLEISSNSISTLDGSKTIESPTNALQFQSNIIIPQYGSEYDQEAQNFYQALGLNVIFATGETMQSAGSVHCMTYTY